MKSHRYLLKMMQCIIIMMFKADQFQMSVAILI